MTWRVALVGCGGMGRHHLESIAGLDGFEAVALCDVSERALAERGEQYGVAARFTDVEAMLDAVRPNIVVVATQTRQHCQPTLAALRRGVSVLCEKPIAIDLAEADAMVEAARASGVKLAINQQHHVNAAVTRARAMIDAGAIGRVVLVRGRNKCGRKSGNEFMEMGTHVTDMMLVMGGAPEWVAGTVWWQGRLALPGDVMEAKAMSSRDRDSGPVAGDRAIAQYGFADGVLGEIHFLGHEKTNNHNFGVDVVGTEGQLAVRASGDVAGGLWHLPRPMAGLPSELGDWRPVDLGIVNSRNDTQGRMYRAFAQAVVQGTEPPGSGAEGRTAFEMVLGIYQSHREGGRRVSLPLADRRHPLEAWRAQG